MGKTLVAALLRHPLTTQGARRLTEASLHFDGRLQPDLEMWPVVRFFPVGRPLPDRQPHTDAETLPVGRLSRRGQRHFDVETHPAGRLSVCLRKPPTVTERQPATANPPSVSAVSVLSAVKKPRELWAVLVLALLLTACIPSSAPSTVKVGLVAPFSGRDAALGYNMLVAARLAIKEWNERGGVGGYYLELVAQDDRNDPEMGALQARKMALDPQMLGVIGHPSAESALAAGPVYRQAGLPAVLVGPALREEDLGGPPVFLLGPTAQGVGREVIRFAETIGAHRLALLAFDPGPPGPGRDPPPSARIALSVEHLARSAGLELAFGGVVSHASGQEQGLSEQLKDAEKTKDTRPDLVFYSGGYAEGGSLLAELRQQDVRGPFLGGPGLANPDLLKIAGPAANGAYYLSAFPYPSQIPEAGTFLSAYRAAAGTDPWPQALLVYDGLNAMLQGLVQASKAGQKPGREALRQGLVQGQSHGLSGLVAFDAQGQQVGARAYGYRIEGMIWPGRPVQ